MKKTLSILLILVLLLSNLVAFAGVDPVYTQGDFTFSIHMGTDYDSSPLTITKYTGPGGKVVIPESFFIESIGHEFTVKKIGPNAFKDKGIVELILPSNLQNIENDAFAYNNLLYISLPSSLRYIGIEAFANNSLRNIDFWEIDHSYGLSIDYNAFARNSLDSLTIPPGISVPLDDPFTDNMENLVFYGGINSNAQAIADDFGYDYEPIPSGRTYHNPFTYYYDSMGHRFRGWMEDQGKKMHFDERTGEQTIGFSYMHYERERFYTDGMGYLQTDHFVGAGNVGRVAGTNRYETAVEVSKINFKAADEVILALGSNFPDALAGAGLAGNSRPILLTQSNILPREVLAELHRLGTKKIYMLGGPGAITEGLAEAIRHRGYEVVRLGGNDRYETAAKIAEHISQHGNSHVFMASGGSFPDALAIGPVAGKNMQPILLTQKDKIPPATLKALKEISGLTDITLVGGEGVISKKVEDQLKGMGLKVDRVAGKDRYDTSLRIAREYFSGLDVYGFNEIIVAAGNGNNFADALVASYMGSLRGAPILLTHQSTISKNVLNYIENKRTNVSKDPSVYLIGGPAVISKGIESAIRNKIK